MEDGPVLCFQHCVNGKHILCLEMPNDCPLCGEDTHFTMMTVPPFRIPFPFVDARHTRMALVIKPTKGTFLFDYQNSSNLHIGVTDSSGVVYDYDEGGVSIASGDWRQCVAVNLCDELNSQQKKTWDVSLSQFFSHGEWSSSRYNTNNHNCFTFVLKFVEMMEINHITSTNQQQFCAEMIVPRTTAAMKYISLFRRLLKDKCIVQDANS